MSRLTGVDPALAAAELRLSALATSAGLAYTLNRETTGGYVRSQADTTAYLAYREAEYRLYVARQRSRRAAVVPMLTWRPIAPFGSSYHNFGAAFDVTMVRGTYEQLGALAVRAGLMWGGLFRSARRDVYHFQLPISILEARARWLARGNAPGVARTLANPTVQAGALMAALFVGGLVALYGQWKA